MEARRALLIRRRRPIGEPDDPVAGAGRMLDTLASLGHELTTPEVALVPWLMPPDPSSTDLDGAPPGPFDVVVLGSHLVNTPDERLGAAWLAAVAGRLAPDGLALIEHHPLDWLETAAESWSERDGRRLGMVEVVVKPPFVSAVSVFEAGAEAVRQPFTARVLSPQELDAALHAAGLERRRHVGPTWIEAGRT